MRGRQSTLGLDEVDEPLAGPGKGETYFERTGKKKKLHVFEREGDERGRKAVSLVSSVHR